MSWDVLLLTGACFLGGLGAGLWLGAQITHAAWARQTMVLRETVNEQDQLLRMAAMYVERSRRDDVH